MEPAGRGRGGIGFELQLDSTLLGQRGVLEHSEEEGKEEEERSKRTAGPSPLLSLHRSARACRPSAAPCTRDTPGRSTRRATARERGEGQLAGRRRGGAGRRGSTSCMQGQQWRCPHGVTTGSEGTSRLLRRGEGVSPTGAEQSVGGSGARERERERDAPDVAAVAVELVLLRLALALVLLREPSRARLLVVAVIASARRRERTARSGGWIWCCGRVVAELEG